MNEYDMSIKVETVGDRLLLQKYEALKARHDRLRKALADIMDFEKIDWPEGRGTATTYPYRVAAGAIEEDKEEERKPE